MSFPSNMNTIKKLARNATTILILYNNYILEASLSIRQVFLLYLGDLQVLQ